jgi:CRISPR system Cascade subunit CasE
MYISKLSIDLRDANVRRDLNDIHELHRTIYSVFPNENSGGTGRILFKKEGPLDQFQQPQVILVVSEKRPDWSLLNQKYFYSPPEIKTFEASLEQKNLFRFEMRANPTKKIDGKRIGLYDQNDQIQWIERKLKDNGMKLIEDSLEIHIEGMMSSHAKAHLKLYSVVYRGVVDVIDKALIGNALFNGIGSGKGYGFGMLTMGPL